VPKEIAALASHHTCGFMSPDPSVAHNGLMPLSCPTSSSKAGCLPRIGDAMSLHSNLCLI
jgi:hypothetical protein